MNVLSGYLISTETLGNNIYLEFVAIKKAPSKNTCNKVGSFRFLWIKLLNIRFQVEIFLREPFYNSYFQKHQEEAILKHVFLLGASF
jgi:hypothetical protein